MLTNSLVRDFEGSLQNFNVPHDQPMMVLMQGLVRPVGDEAVEQAVRDTVRPWMERYGVFKGIPGPARNSMARRALEVVPSIQWPQGIGRDDAVLEVYGKVYRALYQQHPRGWISATSKLLWCRFPDDIVIFDSFVERTITVLQWIDPALRDLPMELGSPPRRSADVDGMIEFYMRYQALVHALYERHRGRLEELCANSPNPDRCPHYLRLFDRFLWGLGSPSWE